MNIFHLDRDPRLAAQYNVDKHVVKIITEINQCLASAYPKGQAPYRWSHYNHPMTKWCRQSKQNFQWAVDHCLALCHEYTKRYGKTHKGQGILGWYMDNKIDLPDFGFTDPPRCFGEHNGIIPVTDDHVEDYRNYYRIAKRHLFAWKNTERPYWI